MAAHGATKKPDLAFISCTELAEPPDCKVVFALGTPYLDGGHGVNVIFLVIHNHDLLFLALFLVFHLISGFNLADIPTFSAFQLAPGRDQHTLAFWTEHRYSMRKHRRLTLLSAKIPLCQIFA